MRILIASALLASTAFAAPAFAQEAPPEGKEFQGAKVLAIAGIDHATGYGDSRTGFGYGGTIGYDYQSGKAVFGVEGEIDGSTAKECQSNVIVTGDRACGKAGRDLYAGVRAGYVVGGKTLLYVKGGYTNARVNATYTSPTTSSAGNTDLDGWRLGTGVEFNATKNIVLRTEYRYSNYDGDTSRHQGVVGVGFKF